MRRRRAGRSRGTTTPLARARHLIRATVRNMRQNLFFAFVDDALGVPVAAGLFYPTCGLLLSPAIAAIAIAPSSVSVIANALWLRRVALDGGRRRGGSTTVKPSY